LFAQARTLKCRVARQQAEQLARETNTTTEEQRKQKRTYTIPIGRTTTDVVAAARGDLTVYSRVDNGEIGRS